MVLGVVAKMVEARVAVAMVMETVVARGVASITKASPLSRHSLS